MQAYAQNILKKKRRILHPLAPHIVCKLAPGPVLQLRGCAGDSTFRLSFPVIFILISLVYDRVAQGLYEKYPT